MKLSDIVKGNISGITSTSAVYAAKNLLGMHAPYYVRKDIAGDDVILFSDHFIASMRLALTEGCMSMMGKREAEFWYEFVAYQNDIQDGIRNDVTLDINEVQSAVLQKEAALEALDVWILNELANMPHQESTECYTPYTVKDK